MQARAALETMQPSPLLNRSDARRVLRKAFNLLTKRQLLRIKVHLVRGDRMDGFTYAGCMAKSDKVGSKEYNIICPAAAACSVRTPAELYARLRDKYWTAPSSWVDAYNKMAAGVAPHFQDALDMATEGDIKQSMWAVLRKRKLA